MANKRYIWVEGHGVLPEEEAWKIREERGYKPNKQIIDDTIPDTQHPVTGKWFNSKSAFRKVTRDLGYTEVGNDPSFCNSERRATGTTKSRFQEIREGKERREKISQDVRTILRNKYGIE
jgi:hypothetical protein